MLPYLFLSLLNLACDFCDFSDFRSMLFDLEATRLLLLAKEVVFLSEALEGCLRFFSVLYSLPLELFLALFFLFLAFLNCYNN